MIYNKMNIARVFPTRTTFTPTDEHARFGEPTMFDIGRYDRVLISCTFTWDKPRAEHLRECWSMVCNDVRLGGVAYCSEANEFVPGMYLKLGITITSRGCPYKCSFCFVPRIEGDIRELDIKAGHIIQDNNFLATSKQL